MTPEQPAGYWEWRKSMVRKSVPGGVQIELTRSCNLRCAFCYKDGDRDAHRLAPLEWVRVLAELRSLGTLAVAFTGGEPLLYEGWLGVMQEARRLGFVVSVLTNGTLVDEAAADALAALLPSAVDISLHGARAESHDAATGREGSFAAAIHACRLLRERGVRLVIKTPVSRWSISELNAIRSLAQSLGALWFVSWEITATEDGDERPYLYAGNVASEHEEELTQWYRVPKRAPGNAVCGVGRAGLTIDPGGEVFPCLRWRHASLGNVRTSSLIEIWQTSLARQEAIRQAREANEWLIGLGGVAAETRFCPALAIRHGGRPCTAYPGFSNGVAHLTKVLGADVS